MLVDRLVHGARALVQEGTSGSDGVAEGRTIVGSGQRRRAPGAIRGPGSLRSFRPGVLVPPQRSPPGPCLASDGGPWTGTAAGGHCQWSPGPSMLTWRERVRVASRHARAARAPAAPATRTRGTIPNLEPGQPPPDHVPPRVGVHPPWLPGTEDDLTSDLSDLAGRARAGCSRGAHAQRMAA